MNLIKKSEFKEGRYTNSREKERIGLWGWLSLYLSGALLLFFLLTHIFVIHYGTGNVITTISVFNDMRSYVIAFVNLGLLMLCIFHGLVGLRRLLLDLEIFSERGDRYLIRGLIILGLGMLIFGVVIFNKFISIVL